MLLGALFATAPNILPNLYANANPRLLVKHVCYDADAAYACCRSSSIVVLLLPYWFCDIVGCLILLQVVLYGGQLLVTIDGSILLLVVPVLRAKLSRRLYEDCPCY